MRLVYFSPVVWDSYEQRPHYVVRDFLAAGGDAVIWINPYASRLPGWRDLYRSDLRDGPLTLPRPDRLSVVDAGGLPIDPLPGGSQLNQQLFWKQILASLDDISSGRKTTIGIGRPTALALEALRVVHADRRFYDAMDDFPEFYRGWSRAATRRVERDIAGRVDRVFASSTHLRDKFAAGRAPVTLLRNAYDMTLLPPVAGDRPEPPHLGFIGCLGGWFDWRMVIRLAEAVHPIPITLVGPRAARMPRHLPANISVHPSCTQAEGARWLQSFTVGLIPFMRNDLTAGVDPIKYYQYRGAGLPILTTRFGDMAARDVADGTFFLDDPAGIEGAVQAALACRPTSEEVARFRADHTWTEHFRVARIWDPR